MDVTGIKFKPLLIKLILQGDKTLTYRKGSKYEFLNVGDTIDFIDSLSKESVGKVEITEKYYENFGDIPIDRPGHEPYESVNHKRETFEKYYGSIDASEQMLVLRFRVTETY